MSGWYSGELYQAFSAAMSGKLNNDDSVRLPMPILKNVSPLDMRVATTERATASRVRRKPSGEVLACEVATAEVLPVINLPHARTLALCSAALR
jgi:hypothetical protein